jgi:hypothetical protein
VKAIKVVSKMYLRGFGYEVRISVIHDTFQTALAQFLAFPGDRVYLEVVSPDGRECRRTQ